MTEVPQITSESSEPLIILGLAGALGALTTGFVVAIPEALQASEVASGDRHKTIAALVSMAIFTGSGALSALAYAWNSAPGLEPMERPFGRPHDPPRRN